METLVLIEGIENACPPEHRVAIDIRAGRYGPPINRSAYQREGREP